MTRRNKGEMMQVSVPSGTRDQIKAHAESLGYANYSDYIRALIEADSGLDLSTEMGNPHLIKHGTLQCQHFHMERVEAFPCDKHPRGCVRWKCRDCGHEEVRINYAN